MANVQHSTLTGADLHEPKGADSALLGTVYVSNGAGGGSWISLPAANSLLTDAGGRFNPDDLESVITQLYQDVFIAEGNFIDLSNPETLLIPIPFDCTLLRVNVILQNAITVANTNIAFTRSDGSSHGSALSVPFTGSAEGSTFSFVPTGNQAYTYASHKYLKAVSDGGSTTACKGNVQALFRRTT